jgi:pantoate kinase
MCFITINKKGQNMLGKINHSPTIRNEVYQSVFASLSGMMANLQYEEEALSSPDQNILDFYSKIGRAAFVVKDQWYKFTDEEIIEVSKPICNIVKAFTNDYEQDLKIMQDNHDFFISFIKKWI